MRKAIPALLSISVIGLVLNLLWENLQAPLYKGYTSFIQHLNWKSILSLLIIGTVIGVGIERWAFITGRWSYTESVPIIPFLKVGITPILQMMIVPILTFYLSAKYKKLAI